MRGGAHGACAVPRGRAALQCGRSAARWRRGSATGRAEGTAVRPGRASPAPSLPAVRILRPTAAELRSWSSLNLSPWPSVPLRSPPTGPSRGCGRGGGTAAPSGSPSPEQWGRRSGAMGQRERRCSEAQCWDSPGVSTMLGSRFSGFTFPSFPVSFFPVLLGTCL